ncbi:tetratricopeptide repeat protein 22 [Magallana gigas]|uniref:tetratricopeptide repeat protein 22 n=1 Tax=Magallana gigas TaxID=29159 RepID=UPI003341B540
MNGKERWKVYKERPGLFHISLTASQNPPAQQIKHRIKVTEKLIRDFPEGFTNKAARNLLGVLYFYDGQYFQAIETFESILEHQPDSLTALANVAFVYQRLKQNSKATKYLSDLSDEQDQEKSGISLADQAFAFIFDCYMEKDVIERNKLPKELLVQSLAMLKKCHDLQTIMEIKFWLGQTYYRLSTQCYRRKGMEEVEKEYVLKGFNELVEIINMTDKIELCVCNGIVSTTWSFLGLLLSRKEKIDDKIKNRIEELDLLQYLDNPESCFKKGLEQAKVSTSDGSNLSGPPTELLIRYALFLKNEGRLTDALEKLNEALEIDNSQGNWFALTLKAGVLRRLERIDESIADRKLACSWNATSMDLSELAKAYQAKYVLCEDKNSKIAQEHLLNASDCFTRSVLSLGQEKRPEIHRAHGRFLREIGEIKEAIECFKRAMEVDTANKAKTSFCQLFETLLLYYRGSQDSERRKIMHEMTYFYDVTLRKHGELTKETEQFLTNYEEEMATLTAYLKHSRSDPLFNVNGKSVSDIITSVVKEDAIKKWLIIVEEKETYFINQEETKLAEKKNNLCLKCRSPVIERQLSVFPDPREKPRSMKYPYDFYVIFSPADRDWVCHILLETLEVSYGYKGAIAERDIRPGSTDIYERVKLIQNCSKILVILGQEFEGNLECEYELAHALKRKHEDNLENVLIPILRNVDGLHQSLRTITFLDAVDDCDWNKLIKAMESMP